jgi:hypothetical protein
MAVGKPPASRSPLKAKPLRNPGQSLDEEIHRILDDKALMWLMSVMFALVMSGMEWWRWYRATPPTPILISVVALVVLAVGVPRLLSLRRQIIRLKLGRDGEKAVGQYLEALREKGCRVFHDLVGDGFNVDHVIIGRSGVYTVETKTISKPTGKDAKVVFNGDAILVNGRSLDRDPVVQSKAQANWLRELLAETTGRTYRVKPVIVFPGWYVESSASANRGAPWVLSPKALPAFIDNEPTVLSDQDVRLAAYHLSRHIRAKG